MYLRALRLKGFKSFQRDTQLVFEPGVAVVIGPNGSGKSNVSDAVMWVLGEQSPSSIRGSSMQDVIFAGSEGKRPSASAEVELTFDNSDGVLSVPTPEVSIGRKVQRGGDTTYTINQASCRLTDIIELTAEMGLGREMHSIIGQGKVETLLASKPSDRRALVEEAAGLGRYKRRRERSEIKLREVRRNLERARDLEKEAASQLAPLRRQANAAELRRSTEGDIGEARGRLLSGELLALDARLDEQRGLAGGIGAERGALDARLVETEAARLAEEEAFTRDLQERERQAARALRARYLGDRLEGCARLVGQRARLLDEIERAGRAERENLAAELEGGAPSEASEANGEQLDLFEEAARVAEEAHAAVTAELLAARIALDERRAGLSRLQLDADQARARGERLQERRDTLARDLARLAAEAGEGSAALEQARTACADAATLAEQAARVSADAELALKAADDESRAAQEGLVTAEAAWRRTSAERAALDAEIDHAGAALAGLRDVDDDVLEVTQGFPGAVTLSGALGCDAGYERALGAALSRFPGAVAVSRDADHWSLLQALKGAGVRLVRLVLAGGSANSGDDSASGAGVAFPGSVSLLDKVTVDDGSGLEELLADVVIVDELRGVPDGFRGLAVTRDGEYYRPSTGELGLAAGVPAAVLLERRSRVASLSDRRDALMARESREQAAVARARSAVETLTRARATAAEALDTAQRDAGEASRRHGGLEADLRALEGRSERAATALAEGEETLGGLDAELAECSTRVADDTAAAEAAAPGVGQAETLVAEVESRHAEALTGVTRARIELEERRARAERAADERVRAQRRADSARVRLAELDRRLTWAPALRKGCAEIDAALSGLRERISAVTERFGDEAADAEGRVRDRSAARTLAEEEVGLRRAADELAERRATVQVETARLEERRAELQTRFDEVAGALETAVFEPPADEAEAASLRARLERLERKRDGIGPVNPLAEAECSRLQEHVDFLREQTRDLEKSVEEIETLIRELTQQIEVDFSETFTVVQENFAHMVTVLFPGGSGRLTAVKGEADGEPDGIAIEVKPARKTGKKLTLLSGGERSLVALAFLLALLLSRPAPFYILDEVEAALDDINIGLFVSLVRDYRDRTQFVVITHQKRTMEAADVLYGVTMGPEGTSRVVSARMAEEEIDQERESSKR